MAFHMQVAADRMAKAASYVIVKSKCAGFNRLAATGVSGQES